MSIRPISRPQNWTSHQIRVWRFTGLRAFGFLKEKKMEWRTKPGLDFVFSFKGVKSHNWNWKFSLVWFGHYLEIFVTNKAKIGIESSGKWRQTYFLFVPSLCFTDWYQHVSTPTTLLWAIGGEQVPTVAENFLLVQINGWFTSWVCDIFCMRSCHWCSWIQISQPQDPKYPYTRNIQIELFVYRSHLRKFLVY